MGAGGAHPCDSAEFDPPFGNEEASRNSTASEMQTRYGAALGFVVAECLTKRWGNHGEEKLLCVGEVVSAIPVNAKIGRKGT